MNVSYQGKTWHKLYVVKFLSLDSMTDDQLKTIFHRGHVVWTSRTSWAAYPRLEPKSNFDSFEVAENLYNINAMERLDLHHGNEYYCSKECRCTCTAEVARCWFRSRTTLLMG